MEINCIFVALLNIVQKQKSMDTILKAITCRYNIVSVIHYQFEIVMANLLNLITLIFRFGYWRNNYFNYWNLVDCIAL